MVHFVYDNAIFILSPLKEMKLKILGSPLPSRVEDVEMEMDTLGPPKPTAVQQRKKSRVKTFCRVDPVNGIGIDTYYLCADFIVFSLSAYFWQRNAK